MKKRFISKKRKKRRGRFFFFFLLFIFGIVLSFHFLNQSKIKIDDKSFVKLLIEKSSALNQDDKSVFFGDFLANFFDYYNDPTKVLASNYKNLVKTEKAVVLNEEEQGIANLPLIYVYNSHQTEEYAPSDFLEYSVNPTVMMADYILQDVFSKNNLSTIVEESKIKDILNQNGWKYSYSYKASRILLENAKTNYPSLKYFVDVHRDSLTRDKTTIEIAGKSYAKTIFLIGLENSNYEANLNFTTQINNLMDQKYPGLSKGIYKKGGVGVNGIYNQDFSPYTILIEIGGLENTTTEVLNSTLAFAECFMEVIKANEG